MCYTGSTREVEKQFHGIGDGKVVVSEEEAALPDDKGSTTMCPLFVTTGRTVGITGR